MAPIKLSVIGFGLMGGSIGKALKGNGNYQVTAYDADENVLEKAKRENAAQHYTTDALTALKDAELIALCLYPALSVKILLKHMDALKSGAIVTDICGVKRYMTEQILPALRKDVSFIPAHPMAGREKKGFAMSDGELFKNCNYLIVKNGCNAKAVEKVTQFALDLGAGNIVYTSPEKHDEYIAFTSQLPHVISCAYVQCMKSRKVADHAAGSMKDVSRVANINAAMWSELFIKNRDYIAKECRNMAQEMLLIAQMIEDGDEKKLASYMQACADAMEKTNA